MTVEAETDKTYNEFFECTMFGPAKTTLFRYNENLHRARAYIFEKYVITEIHKTKLIDNVKKFPFCFISLFLHCH